MAIKLTSEQQQQVDAAGSKQTDVIDPGGRRRYFLLPVDEYEALCDERDQAALRQASLRSLASRVKEDA